MVPPAYPLRLCYASLLGKNLDQTVRSQGLPAAFALVEKWYEADPEASQAQAAIRYLSNYFTSFTAAKDLSQAKKLVLICRGLRADLRESCLQGIPHGLIESGPLFREQEPALAFCAESYLSPAEQQDCRRYASNYLRSL